MQRDSCRLLHTWIQKGSRTTSTTNTTSETTSEAASSLPAAARQIEGVFIASRRHFAFAGECSRSFSLSLSLSLSLDAEDLEQKVVGLVCVGDYVVCSLLFESVDG